MPWATLVQVILTYGIPVAEKLWTLATSGKDPTAQDWADLKALANQTSLSQMQDALARAGIPLTDPKALPFLELVK